jgi:hypothetical protein
MTAATDTQGTLDHAVESLSRGLARRMTRRSALSKLGRYGVAMSLGASGVALLKDERASAVITSTCCQSCRGGCCNCDSYWCSLGGVCPSYTCRCGAWWAGCYCANGARLYYGDCCGNCGCGSYCNCAADRCGNGACNQPGGCSPCPACCHQFQHTSDTGRECGDCGCGCPWYVNCRRAFCG